jgi:hypothetical protein
MAEEAAGPGDVPQMADDLIAKMREDEATMRAVAEWFVAYHVHKFGEPQ